MKIDKLLQKLPKLIILLIAVSASSVAYATPSSFERIVVFGTSLSDPGNGFVLLSDPGAFGFSSNCPMGIPSNVPPYDFLDELVIPDGTYARGGHHVTNGATWIEQYARGTNLAGNVKPALSNIGLEASNYAVGGARARTPGDAIDLDEKALLDCRFNLVNQVQSYLADFGAVSPQTLVVIEMGGNDVRDALNAVQKAGNDPAAATPVVVEAINRIGEAVGLLYYYGARDFMLVNVPAIGSTPAVGMLDAYLFQQGIIQKGALIQGANDITTGFNDGLSGLQSTLNGSAQLPGINIKTFDLNALLQAIINNPAKYGISIIDKPCVNPGVAPFVCKMPDSYLFWDGIHPTKAVHGFMAEEAGKVIDSFSSSP